MKQELDGWGQPKQNKYETEVKKAKDKLGIGEKAVKYTKALIFWARHGFPTRSPEEVSRLYEICKRCEYNQNGTCDLCGCKTNESNIAVVNKIKMKTEICPKDKW